MSSPPSASGRPDRATVTAAGESVLPTIDGVVTRRPTEHLDHRGALFEVYNGETDADFWQGPVVYAYQSSVLPAADQGLGPPRGQDRPLLPGVGGAAGAPARRTRRLADRSAGPRWSCCRRAACGMVRIPAGVWHLLANLGGEEAHVLNFPTERYHHDAPDRFLLPWDTDELPVDVQGFLPKF